MAEDAVSASVSDAAAAEVLGAVPVKFGLSAGPADSGELEHPPKAATAVAARTTRGRDRDLGIGIIYSDTVPRAG